MNPYYYFYYCLYNFFDGIIKDIESYKVASAFSICIVHYILIVLTAIVGIDNYQNLSFNIKEIYSIIGISILIMNYLLFAPIKKHNRIIEKFEKKNNVFVRKSKLIGGIFILLSIICLILVVQLS